MDKGTAKSSIIKTQGAGAEMFFRPECARFPAKCTIMYYNDSKCFYQKYRTERKRAKVFRNGI